MLAVVNASIEIKMYASFFHFFVSAVIYQKQASLKTGSRARGVIASEVVFIYYFNPEATNILELEPPQISGVIPGQKVAANGTSISLLFNVQTISALSVHLASVDATSQQYPEAGYTNGITVDVPSAFTHHLTSLVAVAELQHYFRFYTGGT
jgi:hypothetical protein